MEVVVQVTPRQVCGIVRALKTTRGQRALEARQRIHVMMRSGGECADQESSSYLRRSCRPLQFGPSS